MTKLFTFFLLFVLVACGSSKAPDDSQESTEKMKTVVSEILGADVKFTPNSSKTYMLCTSKAKIDNNTIKFAVYDMTEDEVIYQSSKQIRKVSWVSENEIKAFIMTGVATGTSENEFYFYNVETQVESKNKSENK